MEHYSDGIQFVTTHGTDTNDGLSWGTAKATLAAAYSALPGCTNGTTYAHCGIVRVGAGTFPIRSQLHITSPFVRIEGLGSGSTILHFTGKKGCAILWDTSDGSGNASSTATYVGGLFGVWIKGGPIPNTCGLETAGIVGFQARGVTISGFHGARAIGWWDNSTYNGMTRKASNERFKVSMSLADNDTDWKVTDNGAIRPTDTFGYGDFSLWINLYSGQTAVDQNGGILTYSVIHIIVNSASVTGTTAISLASKAQWFANSYNLHFEGEGTAFDLMPGTRMAGAGVISTGTSTFGNAPIGTTNLLAQIYESSGPTPFMILIGDLASCGPTTNSMLNICGIRGMNPLNIGYAGNNYLFMNTDGTLRASTNNNTPFVSAGTITLYSGTGGHTFSRAFSKEPICAASDMTSVAPVKVTSTDTAITLTGKRGDMIAWICAPPAN